MLLGPLFAPLDDAVFNSEFSIKHVPVADRPRVLSERFGEGPVLVADYSSWESCQRLPLQIMGEMQVYRRCLGTTRNYAFLQRCLEGLVAEVPVIWQKGEVVYRGPTMRFSGEITTSLGNTINNILCLLTAYNVALCSVNGETSKTHKFVVPITVVEGDDSVTALPYTDLSAAQDFAQAMCRCLSRLGLSVKAEVHDHVSAAGYCGCQWNPVTMTPIHRDIVA